METFKIESVKSSPSEIKQDDAARTSGTTQDHQPIHEETFSDGSFVDSSYCKGHINIKPEESAECGTFIDIKQEDRTSGTTQDYQTGNEETSYGGPFIDSRGYIDIKPHKQLTMEPDVEKPAESAECDQLVQPILIVRNLHHSSNATDGSAEVKVEGQGDDVEIKQKG